MLKVQPKNGRSSTGPFLERLERQDSAWLRCAGTNRALPHLRPQRGRDLTHAQAHTQGTPDCWPTRVDDANELKVLGGREIESVIPLRRKRLSQCRSGLRDMKNSPEISLACPAWFAGSCWQILSTNPLSVAQFSHAAIGSHAYIIAKDGVNQELQTPLSFLGTFRDASTAARPVSRQAQGSPNGRKLAGFPPVPCLMAGIF